MSCIGCLKHIEVISLLNANNDVLVKFVDKRSGDVKGAFLVGDDKDCVSVRFPNSVKVYKYNKSNIEVCEKDSPDVCKNKDLKFVGNELVVYKYTKPCWHRNCHRPFDVLTYIVYANRRNESLEFTSIENVEYPWNKHRLLDLADVRTHVFYDATHEYYGCAVLGEVPSLDAILLDEYKDNLKLSFSNTIKETYVANVCPYCGQIVGKNFLFLDINDFIKANQELEVVDRIDFAI